MTISVYHEESGFLQVPNSTIRDNNLSAPVLRTLMLMLSYPKFTLDGNPWKMRVAKIASDASLSVNRVYIHLRELKKLNYAVTCKKKAKDGKFTAEEWFIFSTPKTDAQIDEIIGARGFKPLSENAHVGKRMCGKTNTLNNTYKDNNTHKDKKVMKGNVSANAQKTDTGKNLKDPDPEKPKQEVSHEKILEIRNLVFNLINQNDDYAAEVRAKNIPEEVFTKVLYEYSFYIVTGGFTPNIDGFMKRLDGAAHFYHLSESRAEIARDAIGLAKDEWYGSKKDDL